MDRDSLPALKFILRTFPYLLTSPAEKGRMPLVKDRLQNSETQLMKAPVCGVHALNADLI